MDKIVVTTSTFAQYDKAPLELLRKKNLEVLLNPYARKLTKEEVIQLCRDAVGIIAGLEPLDSDVLEKLKALKVISRCGVGFDNIDMDAAKRLGINVFNTPDAPTLAVAELTVGLMLNLLRRINRMDAAIKEERWEKITGNLIYRKRVGIIGFGRIGRKVAELLKAFGCEIVYSDPFVEDKVLGFTQLSLGELLRGADIVSLHLSGKERILGENELGLMKKSAFLVNISRGGIVDESALFKYLKDSRLAGAAVDVFQQEPYCGELLSLENIILTPHIGSYTQETRAEMENKAVENLLKGL